MPAGTKLFDKMILANSGDSETAALMREIWSETPWMLDVYTGSINSDQWHRVMSWLRSAFGREAWPIHGIDGSYQTGGATVCGWTWIGFKTSAQMRAFLANFQACED